MVVEGINSIDDLKAEIDKTGERVGNINLLCLDLSSSCTGYSIVEIDFINKKSIIKKAGAIWFDSTWDNQEKYHYLFSAVTNYFSIVDKIDYCVCEAYKINTKKMMGSHVGPELHGAIQVSLAEIGVKYSTIHAQTWRSILGIKPNISFNPKGRKEKDFKTPTKDFINNIQQIPSKIVSNITKISRETPDDVFDAIAIGYAFSKKLGLKSIDMKDIKIQKDTDYLL